MKKYFLIIVLAVALSVITAGVAGAQGRGNIHYVQFGETLYSVSIKYGVSAQAIMAQNGITNPDMIYVGQPLIIPGGYNDNSMGYAPNPGAYGCANYHMVVPGETLSDIAYNNGVSVQTLIEQNNLYNVDLVYVGQKICLPTTPGSGYKPQPASYRQSYSPPADAYYHTVASGESLNVIAARYNVDYMEIMRANNLNSEGFIYAGQKLCIPNYHPLSPAAEPVQSVPTFLPEPAAPAKGYEAYGYGHHSHEDYYDQPPAAPYAAPPYIPKYGGGSFDETEVVAETPPAPEHQPVPIAPILPEADHPIEVVVNGGVHWVGTSDTIPDPNSITTLIVKTGDEYGTLVHVRSGDYEVKGESDVVHLGEFGPNRFVFRYVPPGDYDVWIEDPERDSEVVKVKVNPGDRVEVLFGEGVSQSGPTFASPDGWVLSSWDNPSKPKKNLGGWSNILVKTPASGLWVKIESEGRGYEAKCLTGAKGPGACDFAGLTAGLYWIWIDGTGLTVKTYMDGNAYATFEFSRQPSSSGDSNAVGPVDYDGYTD